MVTDFPNNLINPRFIYGHVNSSNTLITDGTADSGTFNTNGTITIVLSQPSKSGTGLAFPAFVRGEYLRSIYGATETIVGTSQIMGDTTTNQYFTDYKVVGSNEGCRYRPIVLNYEAARLVADPTRPRIYATLRDANSVIVIDTNSLSVIKTIPIGSNPFSLAISADGNKLWVANSGSTTAAIGVIDLTTLEVLPSLRTPKLPYDVAEGADHRLYLTSSAYYVAYPGLNIQIVTDTGSFLGYFGGDEVYPRGFLEISPDRKTLYYVNTGVSPGSMDKFDVTTSSATLVQRTQLGASYDLTISHNGEFIVLDALEIPTGDITKVSGSFNVIAYAGPATLSYDDNLVYQSRYGSGDEIIIFDTHNFARVGTIPIVNTITGYTDDLVVDKSGQLLFVTRSGFPDYNIPGKLLIFDIAVTPTHIPTPTPIPTPTAMPTPTITPVAVFHYGVAHLTADPIRPRVYATVPDANSVIVIDTASLSVTKTIPIGSKPQGLAVSSDGNKLWVANSGSTNAAIGVVDLNTLETLPSLPAPAQPYDVKEGTDHRLYLTPWSHSPLGKIMQIDADTGNFQASFGGNEVYMDDSLEISPDRKTLYFGGGLSGTIDKFDVTTANATLIQQANNLGFNGASLRISHNGELIIYPNGTGNTNYDTFEIPTADIASINGTLNVGAYPGPVTFSNDDTLLYHGHESKGEVIIFDTHTFLRIGTISLGKDPYDDGSPPIYDLVVDKSGQWLFVSTSYNVNDPSAIELRIYATNRSDPLVPPPTPTPTAAHTPTPTPGSTPTPTPTSPGKSLNISTRMDVQADNNVLIGGFIVAGNAPKRVIVRGLGPSLANSGIANPLADPMLELHGANGALIASNDNWKDTQQAEIEATGLAPSNDLESAIVATLPANNTAYTVILSGKNNGTGIGLVEGYDLAQSVDSQLANISTRGFVETGNNVMIGGFIVGSGGNARFIVRAIGPSLANSGVQNTLQDPTLELHDQNGQTVAIDDDWQTDSNEAQVQAAGLAPSDPRESALFRVLAPGAYTAIVAGKNNTTGVGLVEAYNLR